MDKEHIIDVSRDGDGHGRCAVCSGRVNLVKITYGTSDRSTTTLYLCEDDAETLSEKIRAITWNPDWERDE